MNWVTTTPNAYSVKRHMVFIDGTKTIDESMTGAVSSLVSSSKLFGNKVTIVSTHTESGELKISTRATEELVQKGVNLGQILQGISPKYNGVGGGHAIAAGATIPGENSGKFLMDLENAVDSVLG